MLLFKNFNEYITRYEQISHFSFRLRLPITDLMYDWETNLLIALLTLMRIQHYTSINVIV